MPIYSFYCNSCNKQEDIILPISERDKTHICSCGCETKRIMTFPYPPIMKKTGKDMALNSLNNDDTVPDRWYKPQAENLVAAGLERPPKTIF
jgi:putative FmdB family regulatory protein